MKQFTFEYENQSQLASNLDRVSQWAKKNKIDKIWIQIYVMEESGECIMPIADTIEFCMPEAKYMISHAGLAFASGSDYSDAPIIVCNLFEYKDTRLEMAQYPFTPEYFEQTIDEIIEYVQSNPWIKLISFNMGADIQGVKYMNRLSEIIDPEIVISGGAAATKNMDKPAKIISSEGPLSTTDLIITYIGGPDFHAKTDVVVGWKGIGRKFTVTKSEGAVLYELDGEPAFNVYKRYLKINAKPGFIVDSTIEFPFCYEDDGILFLRCPFILNEDDSITMMMNDLYEGKKIRLSFGAPDVILDELSRKTAEVLEFEPQVVSVNSCLGRSFFWGDNITNELDYLRKITLSSGYLTGGEILRKGKRMLIFNETIVITAMREGDKTLNTDVKQDEYRPEKVYSLTQRLATFIETVTADLEEFNKTVQNMAITDGLTGLFNRREIERLIEEKISEKEPFSLIMIDADNFKHINDIYGHEEGDKTLKHLANSIQKAIAENEKEIYGARYGGDEFMILMVGGNEKDAKAYAIRLQKLYGKGVKYDKVDTTISVGIYYTGEELDYNNIFQKVDAKLYEAKNNGKNRIEY